MGLTQMVQNSTHEKGKILDLLLTNTTGIINNLEILDKNYVCSSDHFGIKFSIKTKVRTKVTKKRIYNYKKANWDRLNDSLKYVNWDHHLQHCDAETAWFRFKKILTHHLDLNIPTITIKSRDTPPWYDSETHHLCRKKERLRAKFKQTKQADDYKKYSQCRKDFKNLVREKMISNFEDHDDPALISKKFWKHVKSISKSSRLPETVNFNGRFRNNPVDQAEIFNEYFHTQFSETSQYNIDIDFRNDNENDIEFTPSRIRKILKDINVHKACGPDGIHGKVLKNCRLGLAYPLSLLFKTSYNIGQIPYDWKMANVVPLHKKGPKESVENYRPISLTSLVMKVFEKIIRDELLKKCEHKLNNNQHGFMPKKSCTTQMVHFTESLSLSLNDNIMTDVVYFDFAKAFDSVNHDIILKKLKERFKIDGTLLKFIVNYLKNRQQCVVVGGQKSCPVNVTSGVPQGSILGPLFFVLFIDDISECISPGTSILLYADDTKIWHKIENWGDHDILQMDINSLYEWSVLNKMNFHPQKCKVLSVGRTSYSKNVCNIFPFMRYYYTLNNIELEYIDNEKDLGVIVTTKLNWRENVIALCLKASSRLGLMRRTLHFVKNDKQKRTFYLALVRSIFENCSVIWRPTSIDLVQKVESIQRRAVKWILSEHNHHYNELEYLRRLHNLDLLPMGYKFDYTDILLFYKIYYNKSVIKLPSYLTPIDDNDRSRFRTTIKPPDYYTRMQTLNMSAMRNDRLDILSLKCNIEAKSPALKNNFFYRTHLLWNRLPKEIRELDNICDFQKKLKHHMWDVILDPD